MLNKFYLTLGIIGSLSLTACGTDPDVDVITGKPITPPSVTPSEPSTPPVTPNEPNGGGDNNNGNGNNGNGGTTEPPVIEPPVTEPPVTEPKPPVTEPSTPIEPPAPEPGNPFPEPSTDMYDPNESTLGFYDWDRHGNARVFKNHLTGSFAATLQFGQSITTAPNDNESQWHPRPVAEREALLIVIPTAEMGEVSSLSLVATINGVAKAAVALKSPAQQPQADRTLKDKREDVVFSNNAWTTVLPWDWMVPGLELSITDDQSRSGLLAASDLDFAAPGQLVVNQIQLGMLTGFPGKGYMLNSPAAAATDYFHTIPAATLLLGEYDPMQLNRVMIDSGKIYTTPQTSDTTGDVYSGDMRENVGKATFSTGINLANWGITSARLGSQEQPQLTQRAVLHHARGKYTNGESNHGLSGGNGILTLYASDGNEFSHEIGHHYGLGHYPGAEIGPDASVPTPAKNFWDRHHADSGWGYIGYRKRMHSSLYWWDNPNANWADWQAFKEIYYYANDAMAGGRQSSSLSRYTLYTGYSTYLKIQPAFDKVQYSCDFDTNTVTGTGFVKWNKTTRQMESTQPKVPNNGNVWYNNGDGQGNYLKPRLCSVPVFTLLGGYDPEKKTAVMYPAARSNLGNVFNLPAPTISATERRCWVQVDFANGTQQNIAIAHNRLGTQNNVNRYNINLAQADKPTTAAVYCQDAGSAPVQLGDGISIADPSSFPTMKPAVIVGKEHGYSALWQSEKAEFAGMLQGLSNNPIPLLNERGQLLYQSWADDFRDELSFAERSQLERYEELQANMLRLNRWMFAWNDELQGNNAEADQALVDLAVKLKLAQADQPLIPATVSMRIGKNSCLRANLTTGVIKAHGSSECTHAANETWLVDGLNRIHNGADLSKCISSTSPIRLADCSVTAADQTWDFNALPAIKKAGSSQCMDMESGSLGATGSRNIILYNCSGGENQKWSQVSFASDNALLPLLHKQNLPIAQRLSADK